MRKCTCIRCKAQEYVLSIYPQMDHARALLIAERITNALRDGVEDTGKLFTDDVSTMREPNG
jgi:hypothetical protein